MGQVSFRLYIDDGAVRNAVKRSVGPVMRDALDRSGKEMVAEANRLMAQDFNLNRPMERRRHPGSVRAANALDYAITGTDTDLTLGFRVKGGTVVFKRILGMNYGTPSHPITPSGNWSLKGANLSVRANPSRRQAAAGGGSGGWLYFPVPEGGPYKRARAVNHKGTTGTKFLQRARDKAARDLGGRRIA